MPAHGQKGKAMTVEQAIPEPFSVLIEKVEAWLPSDDDGMSVEFIRQLKQELEDERRQVVRDKKQVANLYRRNDELMKAALKVMDTNAPLIKDLEKRLQELLDLDGGRTSRSRHYWNYRMRALARTLAHYRLMSNTARRDVREEAAARKEAEVELEDVRRQLAELKVELNDLLAAKRKPIKARTGRLVQRRIVPIPTKGKKKETPVHPKEPNTSSHWLIEEWA